MKNILVAVDLEKSGQLLVDTAAQLAEKFGSTIYILHIADPEPDFIGNTVGPDYIREVRAKELHREHKLVQDYADQLRLKGIKADSLLIAGATVETIMQETKKLNADLLIIGHHKHGWLYKIFADVTDAAIINKSKVPVLVVPVAHAGE